MQIWILATLLAAVVQIARFSLQKSVRGIGLSTGGATFSRFVFAAPLAVPGAALAVALAGQGWPALGARFWVYGMLGGIAQIVATFCTLALFNRRSFGVGIAFTKTETIMVALFSWALLGDRIPAGGWLAIAAGSLGVAVMSRPAPRPAGAAGAAGQDRGGAIGLGLLAGGLFGISSVGYRGATLAVGSPDALVRAALALAFVTSFQTLAMGVWLALRERGEIGRVLSAWRRTGLIGMTGLLGSLGWFTAFTLENAAYVRSLGQVDLIFGFIVSVVVFHEPLRLRELVGALLLVAAIVAIVLLA